jgi:3-oxoacyl-[acyl-carrier-protein] synthase III
VIRSVVQGCGAYLPERVVTNDELAKKVETSDEWIQQRTGIKQRHIAADGEFTSHLAIKASERALAHAGIKASDLDLIVLATATPDETFPATATRVQAALGMTKGAAFDIQAVCAGFVYGVSVADSLIKGGMASTALVIGAETFSRILDWNDRGTCVLFGDGAGAVVLAADAKPGIHATRLHADGSQVQMLSVPGNVSRGKVIGSPFLQMNGQGVFKFAVRVLEESARETVAAAGMQLADIDWLIPHQANVRILEATARKLQMPREKLVVTVDHHGNTSAASVPLALDEFIRNGRIRPGDRLLLQGVGGGFTWGSSVVTL